MVPLLPIRVKGAIKLCVMMGLVVKIITAQEIVVAAQIQRLGI